MYIIFLVRTARENGGGNMAGRCSLCGSRLNNGKCEFCGLDNRMYDRNYLKDPYHLAEIAREADTPKAPPGQTQRPPGTPGRSGSTAQKTVFTANPPARHGAGSSSRRQKQDVSSWQKRQNSGASRSRAVIVIVILVILICIAGPVLFQIGKSVIETGTVPDTDSWQSAVDSLFSDDDSSLDFNDYDAYDYVTREIPEDGTDYEVTLSDGFYQVGIHIPEGVYHVELAEESADLHIADTENIIYDSVWFGDETEYDEVTEADDIRLYNGAEISITGGGSLLFTTDNAQPFTQETAANPLTESFILEEGSSTAGEYIPEGMYDILLAETDEYISFGLEISYPNELSEYLWASNSSGEPEERIRNVIIPAGTELTLDGGPVKLEPSGGYFEADLSDYPWN